MRIFVPNNIEGSPKYIPHLQYYEQGRTRRSRLYQYIQFTQTHCGQGMPARPRRTCLQRREDSKGRWTHRRRTSPSTLMPLGCPVCLQTLTSVHLDFSSGPNYYIPHPLLSTLTLVFRQSSVSGLLVTPLHPHNCQPSVFHSEVPRLHPHSLGGLVMSSVTNTRQLGS